jgi:Uma2 family endonuclease
MRRRAGVDFFAVNTQPIPGGRRPATYDDLVALPEHVVGEIVDGELHVSPRPAPRHSQASSALTGWLNPAFGRIRGDGPGGWWILDEPELHFRRDVLVPDIGGWRRERMPELPATAWFELAPDWVCEVLSPSTARFDRLKKLRVYAREGVGWFWMVDPLERTFEVLRLDSGRFVIEDVHGDDETLVRIPPFDEIEIDLREIWGEPTPPSRVSEGAESPAIAP